MTELKTSIFRKISICRSIALNTATALDVRYDEQQRLLRLRQGEIYIVTAADIQRPPRPFLVQSDHGLMLALGTRFTVRQQADNTLLAVYEGAVQIHPDGASAAPGANVIEAGRQVRFDRNGLGRIDLSVHDVHGRGIFDVQGNVQR